MNWGWGHKCSDHGINVLGDIEESLESLLVVGPLFFWLWSYRSKCHFIYYKTVNLEDPRGVCVCECSDPGPCGISWAKLSVVPLLLCFAWFWMCYLHLLIKRVMRGKVWWQETKDHYTHLKTIILWYFEKQLNYGIWQVFNCRQKRLRFLIK